MFVLETKVSDGTAIGNGWIFFDFGFWKAKPSVPHIEKTSILLVLNQFHSQSEGTFDVVIQFWRVQKIAQTKGKATIFKWEDSIPPTYNYFITQHCDSVLMSLTSVQYNK